MEISAVLQDFRQRGFHLAAVPEGIEIMPASALTDADREAIRKHKADLLAVLSPQPGICPKCHTPATLQQREPLTFWCPGCRIFSNAEGREYPKPVRAQMLCLEVVEARQLVADLMAAGCEIKASGSEIAISNLGKLSEEIWARLEQAGPDFLRAAREMAEDFKNERGGEWKH